jgi:general secretion pathway protein G
MFTRIESIRRRPVRRRRGFTLNELLLVLVILGILAAIVVTNFSGRGEDAQIKAATTQIGQFAGALKIYETDNSQFPDDAQGLNALMQNPGLDTWKQLMSSIPQDPWQHDYIYHRPGTHNPNTFDVYSMGPDGKEGTEDDIGNWAAPRK